MQSLMLLTQNTDPHYKDEIEISGRSYVVFLSHNLSVLWVLLCLKPTLYKIMSALIVLSVSHIYPMLKRESFKVVSKHCEIINFTL